MLRHIFGRDVWVDELRRMPVATIVSFAFGGLLTLLVQIIGIPTIDNWPWPLTGLSYAILFFAFSFCFVLLWRLAAYKDGAALKDDGLITPIRSGPNVQFDCSIGTRFELRLKHHACLVEPANIKEGHYTVYLVQDDDKPRTVSYYQFYELPGDVAPCLSTTKDAVDILEIDILRRGDKFVGLTRLAFNKESYRAGDE